MKKIFCKRCNCEVHIPYFTAEVREELREMAISNRLVSAVDLIRRKSELDLFYGKTLVFHLNKVKGQCIRCNNSNLERENSVCPKCQAFNLNW